MTKRKSDKKPKYYVLKEKSHLLSMQVASRGGVARTFVALFFNRDRWLSIEELADITGLSESTIICHAIPRLKKLKLVEEKEENRKRYFKYVPILKDV